jgi:hypothetical protein
VWNSRLLKESNMFNSKLGLLLVVVLLVSVVPVVGAAGHNNTIVDIAVNDGRFTTLVAAVSATGLVDVLSGSE